MRQLKKPLLVLIFIVLTFPLFSQKSTLSVTGNVRDSIGGLPFVTVIIYKDSVVVTGNITDENGDFTISGLSAGKYNLSTSALGYANYSIPLEVLSSSISLGEINLITEVIQVEGVVISTNRKVFTMKNGGLTALVEDSPLASLETALEIVKCLPGVTSRGKDVTVLGKGQPTYYMNGKLIKDPEEIEVMDASSIKSMELITNPGAEYDGSVRAVIKITTKASDNGFAVSAKGNGEVYFDGEKPTYWTLGSVGISYSNKKFGMYTGYMYRYVETFQDEAKKMSLSGKNPWEQSSSSYKDYSMLMQSAYLGLNYSITDKHVVGIESAIFHNSPNGVAKSTLKFVDNGVLTDSSSINYPDKNTFLISNTSAFYKGSLTDKLRANIDGMFYFCRSEMSQSVTEFNHINSTEAFTKSFSNSDYIVGSINASLSYDFDKAGILQAGIRYNRVETQGSFIVEAGVISSNEYSVSEEQFSPYIKYDVTVAEKLDISLGVRYEHISTLATEFDSTILNNKIGSFLPSVSLAYPIKDKGSVSLSFSQSILRPTFDTYNSAIMYNNKYSMSTGNPYILPTDIFDIELGLTYDFFMFKANYQYLNNYLSRMSVPGELDSRVVLSKPVNFKKYQMFTLMLNTQHTVGIWKTSTTLSFKKPFLLLEENIDGVLHRETYNTPSININWQNAFSFLNDKSLNLFANASFTSTGHYGLSYLEKSYGRIDLGISKSFLKKALSISLWYTGVGNLDITNYSVIYPFYSEKGRINTPSSYLTLTVKYAFHTIQNKSKGRGAGSEVISRIQQDEIGF